MIKEISLSSLWRIFKKRIVFIIIITLIAGLLMGVYTKLVIKPKYSSVSTFYVKNMQTENDQLNSSNITAAQTIVKTYIQIAQSNTVLSAVIDQAGYTGRLTDEKLKNMLEMSSQNNTEVFYIQITSTNSKFAYDIACAFEIILPEKISEIMNGSTSVLDKAKLATEPDSPNLVQNVIFAVFFGAVISCAFFFILEYTRTKIYTEEDIKTEFKLPIVGQIVEWDISTSAKKSKIKNAKILNAKNFNEKLINEKTPFMITENFKTLRTNLFYTTNNEKCPVYAITSCMINAGKSIVIANLAVSYAQIGEKRILLIDADMRCPVQHKIFNISNKIGLSELLADSNNNYGEFITKANNLDIITSGRIPPNPSELLASSKMKDFMDYAKENYDLILMDLPPIGEVSDPGIIAPYVTGYLFVIRSGYTDIRLVKESIESMQQMKANITGFVLNDINPKISASYSSYSHKYGYKKYGYKKHGHDYYQNGYRSIDTDSKETESTNS